MRVDEVFKSEAKVRPKYREIFKLAGKLVEAGIPFEFNVFFGGAQIVYFEEDPDRSWICSVIEHDGSYGHEIDQLEIMGLTTKEEDEIDSVAGPLSAEEVFRRISEDWKERSANNGR